MLRYRLYDIDLVITAHADLRRADGDARRRRTWRSCCSAGLAVGDVGPRGRGVDAGGGGASSGRRGRGSRRSSTGASTAAATTPRARLRRSAAGCATSSTSRRSRPTCAASCRDGAARARLAVAAGRAMSRWLAWALWIAIVGSFVGVVVDRRRCAEDGEGNAVAYTVFILAFATVGALVASRQPRNPIGWLLLGAALAYTIGGLTSQPGTSTHGPAPALRDLGLDLGVDGGHRARRARSGCCCSPTGGCRRAAGGPSPGSPALAIALTVVGIALQPGPFEDDRRSRTRWGSPRPPACPTRSAVAGGARARRRAGLLDRLAVRALPRARAASSASSSSG